MPEGRGGEHIWPLEISVEFSFNIPILGVGKSDQFE